MVNVCKYILVVVVKKKMASPHVSYWRLTSIFNVKLFVTYSTAMSTADIWNQNLFSNWDNEKYIISPQDL